MYPIFVAALLSLALWTSTVRPPALAESPAFVDAAVRFRRVTTEQGLSNSRLLSIIQDRQGYIWIGTAEGLDRYDGQDFVHFQHDVDDPNSISNNVVSSLYEDSAGYIWAGTAGGLNLFDPATESFIRYQHDPDNAESLGDNNIYAIYEDRNGVLWVGTGQGGLDSFDRQSETFTHYEFDPNDPLSLSNNYVTGIAEDQAGTLWVATYGGGLNQLLPGKGAGDPPTFRRFQAGDDPQSLSNQDIQLLYVDHLGLIWLGTWGGGLDSFDPNTQTFTHYRNDPHDPSSISSNTINALAEDSHGDLWVGTWDGGLNHFNRASRTFSHFRNDTSDPASLSQDTVRSLFITDDDMLFAGTAGGGLNLLDLKPNPFHYVRNEPDNSNTLGQNDVRTILQASDGILWLGTNTGGLDAYDPSTGLFTHYRHDPDDPTSLSNDTVWSLLEDREGNFWVGTFAGLDKLDRKSGRFTHYRSNPDDPHTLTSDRIYYLHQGHGDDFWVGTYSGLNRFDPQTGTATRYLHDPDNPNSLSNDTIGYLHEDASGILWVGTQAGLDRLEPQTGTITRYRHDPDDPTSLSNDIIRFIISDPNGFFWIGTFGGLNRFDPKSGQARHYTMKNGLSSDVVWGILPDNRGNLWLSTTNGLDRFETSTGAVHSFDASDGLYESDFNARAVAMSSSGEFILGSSKGLVLFPPDQVGGVVAEPPLAFTDFQLANRPVAIGGDSPLQQSIDKTSQIKLSFDDRVLSLAFVAIEYRVPDNIRYRYVLRGFETHWTEVNSKRRFVTYTNLSPGSYVFQVQNTDSNGQWIVPGRSLSIVVVPPWWQTVWFRIAVGGLLLLAAAGAYGFRVKVLQQTNKELEEQVSRRTTSLRLLNTELEDRIIEISTLNKIAEIANRTISIESMNEEIVVIMTGLFHSLGAAICLPGVEQSEVKIIEYHRAAVATSAYPTTKQAPFELASASFRMPQPFLIRTLFRDNKSLIFEQTQSDWTQADRTQADGILADGTLSMYWSANGPLSMYWSEMEAPKSLHAMLVPIFVRGEIMGAIALARPKAEQSFSQNEVTLAETIAMQLAAAYENNRLFEKERRQRALAEQRSTELATLLSISQDVSSMLELEPLLNLLLYHLSQVVDFSTILILEQTGEELSVLAQQGVVPAPLTEADEFPVEWLQTQTLLFESRKPLIWADLTHDLAAQEGMYKTFGNKMTLVLRETRSCLIVPMVSRDTIIGYFWFGHKQPERYSEAQAEYIAAVSHQAVIAIENAREYQEMQIAAADRERNRLAQELHDSVSQSLLAATKTAESLPILWDKSPEQGKYVCGVLQRMMEQALAEMRTLMLELRPAILAQKPLGEIMRQLRDSFAGRSLLAVQLHVNGDALLPAICQVAFYRIAQAALDNIQQHGEASQVTIVLNCRPKFVEMWIADDGKGFDPASVPPDRMGLNIMRERAEKIGASFQVKSEPGRGTQITLHFARDLAPDSAPVRDYVKDSKLDRPVG